MGGSFILHILALLCKLCFKGFLYSSTESSPPTLSSCLTLSTAIIKPASAKMIRGLMSFLQCTAPLPFPSQLISHLFSRQPGMPLPQHRVLSRSLQTTSGLLCPRHWSSTVLHVLSFVSSSAQWPDSLATFLHPPWSLSPNSDGWQMLLLSPYFVSRIKISDLNECRFCTQTASPA